MKQNDYKSKLPLLEQTGIIGEGQQEKIRRARKEKEVQEESVPMKGMVEEMILEMRDQGQEVTQEVITVMKKQLPLSKEDILLEKERDPKLHYQPSLMEIESS